MNTIAECATTSLVSAVPDDLRWTPDLTSRDVGVARIEDIAFTPMSPQLRNELITRTYGDLAEAMAGLFGTDDATWAGFGQWASSTIGGYLNLPIPGFGYLISRAFGDGNRDVFADIGRAHTTFLATVGAAYAGGGDLDEAWAACEKELRYRLMTPPGGPGGGTEAEFWASMKDPRYRRAGPNHNQLLVLGFRAYCRALRVTDAEERSQHILLGNCLIAFHEQRVLSLAISIGFRSWLRTITTPWRILQTRNDWRNQDPHSWRLRLEHWWIRFATEHLIGVAIPNGTVKTGKPVPPGDRAIPVVRREVDRGRQKSRSIESLDDPTILGTMFTELDVDGRPAECWNNLRDRMAFIIGLFAEHQRAGFWLDEHGSIVRPKPGRGFERSLRRQVESMQEVVGDDDQTTPVPSPLSDAELDALRSLPTHVPLDDPDSLSFESVADDTAADRFKPINDDVAARHARITEPGQHLDPETCLAARAVFKKWSTVWFMGLLFRSLPDSYASAAGVHVLGRMSDLATDPFRRSGETAQFVVDLLAAKPGWDRGSMEPKGPSYRSVLGVRRMHSIVTHRLLGHHWDSAAYGLPLNQEDVVGAALTFGVSAVEMIDGLGVDLDDRTRDSYVRFWLGIGFLLGAPYEAITIDGPAGRTPLDFAQAQALAAAIRRRHRARSLDGVRLTEALIDGVADGFPRSFGWMSPGLMRVLGDQRINSVLLVGEQGGRRRAALLALIFRFMLRFRFIRPLARLLIRGIGRLWIRPFLEQGRTRPYRRPRQAMDERRIKRVDRADDYWPINCGDEAGSTRGRRGRPSRRRRRRPQRQHQAA